MTTSTVTKATMLLDYSANEPEWVARTAELRRRLERCRKRGNLRGITVGTSKTIAEKAGGQRHGARR